MPRKYSRRAPPRSDGIVRLTDSANRGELVAIVGTGVSIGLTDNRIPALSWMGLILNGFAYGVQKGKVTAAQEKAWKTQLDSTDLDDLLGAAEFMGRKLDAPSGDLYARWLENVFKEVQPTNKKMQEALRALIASGIPLCTLNYDPLLERVTGLPAINLSETVRVAAWMRKENPGILHLHGSWDAPATCILGIRDYATTLGDDVRDLIQRSLGSFRRLLFIGCGDTFADPNFSALIKWLRETMKTAAPEHCALVSDGDMAVRHADPAWVGFVEPLSYGSGYDDLPVFLLKHFRAPTQLTKKGSPAKTAPAPQYAKVLQHYRAFLLKDCGQMTIEGVRADMDTAQRRFDLERLFVPLKVLPSPPEIPEADPQREQKLLKWQEKNKEPRPFGEVFAENKRLALLALPGGGKTLLLKRLAVAYADPARRPASNDALPDLDIAPVLIRCREWREHIHRPILTLLQNMSQITGEARLADLSDALLPLFKKGRILLLVDGLDEIHDDALRSTFVEHLEAFLEEYKRTRLLVTSREAGFSLVAPCLARFCGRWRVAPLEESAITALCDHWHRLMTGDSPEAQSEGREVARNLLRNESLRRLAENPLLLTMLLVVKHGAGRLPPDRVSLYSRAVEVLLDTWNIKGHDPLNPKEAVPQLAFVAFQLMRARKQTATGKELLALLEEARENVPQIRRYAKDTPQEFLKRVELRSSLLVEAGRQAEGGGTVPFYQFRHLTFQEYLAAVAVVEGHYMEYEKGDSVLTPLEPYLTSEDWKEVIPMSAVLARKQAEPIMAALVQQGNGLRQKVEAKGNSAENKLMRDADRLPAPVARLARCLVEEAEAAPETLTAALQLVAFFAKGCSSPDDWGALSRGPYGEELLHQAWLLYEPMRWPPETWMINTVSKLSALCLSETLWSGKEGHEELRRLLNSPRSEEIARGLGAVVERDQGMAEALGDAEALCDVEEHLFHDEPSLWALSAWAWALQRVQAKKPPRSPSLEVLDRLLSLFLSDAHEAAVTRVAFALTTALGMPRAAWKPTLTEAQANNLRRPDDRAVIGGDYFAVAAVMVAFYAGGIWPEEDLAKRLDGVMRSGMRWPQPGPDHVGAMLEQMGTTGRKYLRSKELPER